MSPRPVELEGRRLRAVRLSPVVTAIGLGLVVVAFVGVLGSALTGVGALAIAGWLAGAAAVALVARFTWVRLMPRGKVLFGLPAALVLAWIGLHAAGVPGAALVGYAACAAWVLALGLGIVGRPGPGMQLARGSVEPTLVRSEVPAENVRLCLDADALSLIGPTEEGSDRWPLDQIAEARLAVGARIVLRIVDRLGDDVAVELAPSARAEAEELVRRVGAAREQRAR